MTVTDGSPLERSTEPTGDTENKISANPSPPASISKDGQTDFNPGWRFFLALLTLSVITLAAALDATSLSVALAIIAKKLKGTAIEAFWAGTSFLLTSTVFQPNWASFSHIFGRKPMLLAAVVFFTVGAIIAGVSKNFAVLLVGRSLQGVGGGGIFALTDIIITDLVPLRLRGKYFGFISMMWSIGSVSGPIVGGAFAEKVSWRWIFWVNLPFAGIAFVMIPLFLKLNFKANPFGVQLRRVDWFGSFLFVASTTSFLIPVTWGGVMYAWDSWRTLVPLILGAAGLIAFIPYEIYVAEEPVIRFSIFRTLTAVVNYAGTFMHGMILWGLLYYLPLYYEAVQHYSPIISGVAIFPQTFTVAPAAVVVGIAVTITGRYRWALWAGWVLATLGTGLLYLLDVHTSVPAWIFLNLVSGLGMGLLFPSMNYSIQAAVTTDDIAFAVAMFSFFRSFGQAVGVAVGGVIFQNEMEKKLLAYPDLADRAREYSRDSASLIEIIKDMPDSLPQRAELVQAYADSLKMIWLALCAFSAFALFLSLFTKGYSLDRALETEQGFKHKEKSADAEEKVGVSPVV